MKLAKTDRPVNLDIATIKLPITAYTSILHRVSGVILFGVLGVLLWMLDMSLRSPESFAALQSMLDSFFLRVIVWAMLSALAYHLVAGIRHLLMDFGLGESLEGGQLGAKVALVVAVILILLLGVWLW